MRMKYFLAIVFGTLACMLVADGLVLQPLTNQDSNLVFAKPPSDVPKGPPPGVPKGPKGPNDPPVGPNSPVAVPEPSTLIFLGMGLTGIGIYFYSKRKDKK